MSTSRTVTRRGWRGEKLEELPLDEDEDFVTFRFIHEVINKIKERDEVQS